MTHGPFLSLIIPVHNEASTLRPLLDQWLTLAGQMAQETEVILIDDGSTDSTATILKEYESNPGWRVIRYAQRRGTGASRKAGHALAQGQWIAWIDADGTYDPGDIVTLVKAIDTAADQIIGARTHPFWSRDCLRNLFKRLIFRWASGRMRTAIPDLNSGLRLIRRESAVLWQNDMPDGFSCASTATLAALAHAQKIVFTPVSYQPRHPLSRSKFHPFTDTLRLLRVVARFRASS